MGRIVGDWELGEAIGQGGMGVVYAATHRLIEGEFALKMLRPELAKDPSVVKRFLAEVQKARVLEHPNIVRMEIPFSHDGSIYLPMEMLRGHSLADLLHDEPGPWPIDRSIDHIRQAAEGLGHAHARSVLHRDVKPENLYVTHTGRVKLLDFGLAKRFGDHSLTARGMAVGTPIYMAPEVLRGEKPTAASDIYSLGVIAFRLLTGQHPIPVPDEGATLAELFGPVLHAHEEGLPRASSLQSGLPEWLDDLAARLLDKDPSQRPGTGAELARILETHPTRSDGSESMDNAPARSASGVHFLGAIDAEGTPRLVWSPNATNSGEVVLAASGSHVVPGSVSPTTLSTIPPIPPLASAPPSSTPPSTVPPRRVGSRVAAFAGIAIGIGLVLGFALRGGPTRDEPAAPSAGAAAAATSTGSGDRPVAVPFSSEPAGAFVAVDGKVVCKRTPCVGRVAPGYHYVTMRRDRYQLYDRKMDVQPRGVHARLAPSFGWLEVVTIPPGVRVAVDGKAVGATPIQELELAPGRHVVEVRDPRFRRAPSPVTVQAATRRHVTLKLVPRNPSADPKEFDDFFKLDVPPEKTRKR